MIRVITALLILFGTAGCRMLNSEPEKNDLAKWQRNALTRNLPGETAIMLSDIAAQVRFGQKSHLALPDLAAFIREAPPGRGDEISREKLWESMISCIGRFSENPEKDIQEFCAGELRCRTALLLAEKQYLYQILWKTPAQQQREQQLDGELYQFFGRFSEADLGNVPLIYPSAEAEFPPVGFKLHDSDPAAILQVSGVIYRIPGEIQRQSAADLRFIPAGIITETTYLAANCAMLISSRRLAEAKEKYLKDPTPENLWQYRKWYYRMQLDHSRLPAVRGSDPDREFVNAMLLLQESF
jgi:hypothetical protein